MTWQEWREKNPPFIGPKGPQHHISFPGCCHYEENRQNSIDIGNYRYRNGWLPCGDNWWIPLKKNIEHHHYPDVIEYTIHVKQPDGSTRRLVNE